MSMIYAASRFPAPVLRSRTLGEFTLTETLYGQEATLPMHAHENACLVFVLRGRFHERYDARERMGRPGMVIIRPAGEPHADRFDAGGGACLNVELSPRWVSELRGFSAIVESSASTHGAASAWAGPRLCQELSNGDDLSSLAVESLVLAALTDATRQARRSSGTPPLWLLRARDRMRSSLSEHLTLDDVAAAAGVHPVHLAHTFRRVFGQTVGGYMRQLRIEHACDHLATSCASMADVALGAGFFDQSHFCRVFKREMRMTPSEYRRAHGFTPAADTAGSSPKRVPRERSGQ
jgi:AraC family transcriptional regulator